MRRRLIGLTWAKMLQSRYAMALPLVVAASATCTIVWGKASSTTRPSGKVVVLNIDPHKPGGAFEVGSVGLSAVVNELATDRLSGDHNRLVRLMRLLGPSVLRLGAGPVDFSWWTSRDEPPPRWAIVTITPTDLRRLRGLLNSTGWRVLLGVDLGHFEPARAADEARYARAILGTHLAGIEIGNEPDGYSERVAGAVDLRPPTYDALDYLPEAETYRRALSTAVPGIAVYGPALSGIRWLPELGTRANMFSELTQHYYPTSACPDLPPTAPAADAEGLLSPAVRQQENEILEILRRASALTKRPTRIGETNAVATCSKDKTGRATLASALWALDWALRAASSGVSGINFHGAYAACQHDRESPICAASKGAADDGDVRAQPEYYGLLAASRLEGGRFVQTTLTANEPIPNLTAWATISSTGELRIAIDNLAISGAPKKVTIRASDYIGNEEFLIGRSAGASSGVYFAKARVSDSGRWLPNPQKLRIQRSSIDVILPPSSAVVMTLRHQAPRQGNARHQT